MPQSNIHRYLKHGTLPQLSVFEASARLGSFTRAAEELYMAQPTVSVQIKKLTETIGLPLFEQVGKRIYLTEAGREAVRRLRGSVSHAVKPRRNAGRVCAASNPGTCGSPSAPTGKYFAPRMLAGIRPAHPGVEVSLQIHNRRDADRAAGRQRGRSLHLRRSARGAEVVAQPILPNPMVVFARADHPLAREKRHSVRAPRTGTVSDARARFGNAPGRRRSYSRSTGLRRR